MDEIIKSLIKDEHEAIDAYSKAIKELEDKPEVVAVLEHIKGEEEEHVEELEGILKGEHEAYVEEFKRMKSLGI